MKARIFANIGCWLLIFPLVVVVVLYAFGVWHTWGTSMDWDTFTDPVAQILWYFMPAATLGVAGLVILRRYTLAIMPQMILLSRFPGIIALESRFAKILFFACLLFVCGCNWSEKSIKESTRRGQEIVSAINKYHSEKDALPSRLAELSPDYLPSIPNPTVGSKVWEYEVYATNRYQLRVVDRYDNHFRTESVLFYDCVTNEWFFIRD
jgi:hypothetical protein